MRKHTSLHLPQSPVVPWTHVAHRKCETGSRASLLLTVFVILFVLVLVALFAREWTLPGDDGDQGTGYMTKAKIVITHIQVRFLQPPMLLAPTHRRRIPTHCCRTQSSCRHLSA